MTTFFQERVIQARISLRGEGVRNKQTQQQINRKTLTTSRWERKTTARLKSFSQASKENN
jgi:hypothetical protein